PDLASAAGREPEDDHRTASRARSRGRRLARGLRRGAAARRVLAHAARSSAPACRRCTSLVGEEPSRAVAFRPVVYRMVWRDRAWRAKAIAWAARRLAERGRRVTGKAEQIH